MGPSGGAEVIEVATRAGKLPWTDDTLIGRLAIPDSDRVIAVDAPLTQTACGRCKVEVCRGPESCIDPAVVWLRTVGRNMMQKVAAETVGGPTRTEQMPQ